MDKRKTAILVIFLSGAILASLLIFSNIYLSEDGEGNAYQPGTLSEAEDYIAYVENREGLQSLILANKTTGDVGKLLSAKKGDQIKDLMIDMKAQKVTYLVNSQDKSALYSIDFDSQHIEKLMTEQSPVPETEVGKEKIYYIKGEYQHSDEQGNPFYFYDLYSYDLKEKKSERLTEQRAYFISSLNYDSIHEKLFFVMNYSESGDPFKATQSIYEISLSDDTVRKIETGRGDVFGLSLSPAKNEIIFTGIANPETTSSYKYELFSLNLENSQTKRVTFLEAFTTDPVFSSSGKEVYFVFNEKFPGRNASNYELYELNRETLTSEKSTIPFNMD